MKRATILAAALLAAGTLAAAAYGQGGYGDSSTTPAPQAQAGAVRTQVRTALTHAGFAATADTPNGVVQHLGHALNCLEGEGGKNFNRSWGHVCQGQGRGILSDLRASPGNDLMLVAQAAADLAAAGTRSRNVNESRMAAKGVAALLQVMADVLK
ncbi:MAG: hypothetical protein QN183_15880 [Armatimonadota bacterium]|nr:hypothetical protein [Armatimonadota bacterium]